MPEIDRWLRRMVELQGSDLHLRAGAPPMWRIHGHLAPIPGEQTIENDRLGTLMCEIVPEERWRHYLHHHDSDLAYALGNEARFRVNFFRQLHGYGCVLRHIPARVQTLSELGAPDVLKTLPNFRSGLVLVTGPTGSGKSTTLAAIIDQINRTHHKHVVTIEDPIEFVHENICSIVTQRELGSDTPEFAQALKDALREDPDVIMVGEMRDLETIALAITLAETGVLIFATLHTNSAAKTIDRIIDVFPSGRQQQVRTMLASSLRAIVAQQLLRRADGKGRIAAHEVLLSSPALGNIIREGHTEKIASYLQSGRSHGMIGMDRTLRNYLEKNLITGREAYMFALDKSQFEQYSPHALAKEAEEAEEAKEPAKETQPPAAQAKVPPAAQTKATPPPQPQSKRTPPPKEAPKPEPPRAVTYDGWG
jgi:twitching motility protein PilT